MIRFAKTEDIESIYSVMKISLPDCWSLSSIKEYIGTSIVFEDENSAVCGFIIYSAVLDEADILEIAVTPEKRRHKIATELLNYFLDLCRDQNISSVFLEVRSKNLPAISLYAKCGFTPISERKNYYHYPPDDALIMNFSVT